MKLVYATLTAVSAAALSLAAAQADETRDFSNVKSVSFERMTGTVDLRIGGDKVSVVKTDGTNVAYPIEIGSANGAVTVLGEDDPEDRHWQKGINWKRDHENAFKIYLEAYPTFTVTVPAGTAVSFDDAVVLVSGGDLNGAFHAHAGYVEGRVGDLASAEISIHSSADLIVGDIAGDLDLSIHGSGDFTGGRAATMVTRIHGSGDVILDDIGADASVSIHGSGDVELGAVGGAFAVSTHGSGDVVAAAVNGGADISVNGSSDIEIASVGGPTAASIRGSGDVEIAGGVARDLRVTIAGSGDFSHLGVATNPVLSTNGSGSIYVRDHEGTVRTQGHGDITVSGVDYSDDD